MLLTKWKFMFLVFLMAFCMFSACTLNEPMEEAYLVQYKTTEGGKIQGNTEQTVKYGESTQAVTAIAEQGYEFVKWSDEKTETTRVEENVTSNTTVTAQFKKLEYTVKYIAEEGGKIQGNTEQTVKYGESTQAVKALAEQGYEFVKWSDEKTETTRIEENVTSNKTVTAQFKKREYTVKYIAEEGGKIQGNTEQTVKYGESTQAVTAIAEQGYEFVKWSDEKTETTRIEENVTSNKTVTAQFKKLEYTVKYIAEEGGKIQGNTEQTVKYGESTQAVTAIANYGFYFIGWSDDATSPIRNDTDVKESFEVKAKFKNDFDGGQGTNEDPFLIASYEQLLKMKEYPCAYYKLINNLDLSNELHEPMFNSEQAFKGVFDGDNKVISNLIVDTNVSLPSLFGSVGDTGQIKNISLDNVRIIAPNYKTENNLLQVGAIAGVSLGKLENINVSGVVIISDGQYYDRMTIGGVVGQASNTLINCHSDMEIQLKDIQTKNSGDSLTMGGLIGICNANIIDCDAVLKVNVSKSPLMKIGGLIGYLFDGSILEQSELVIEHSYAEISLSTDSSVSIGGFVNTVETSGYGVKIENCHAEIGDIKSSEGQTVVVGGFAVETETVLMEILTINNCYASGSIYLIQGSAAGFACYFQGKVSKCYFNGKIDVPGFSAGFCYQSKVIASFYQCYAVGEIKGKLSAGFIWFGAMISIEQCIFEGTVNSLQGGGFAGTLHLSEVKNCYSTADVIVKNWNMTEGRTLIGGFADSIRTSSIENCYYTGNVIGDTEYVNDSFVGAFARLIQDSNLLNVHYLAHEDTVAMYSYKNSTSSSCIVQITVYDDIKQMYNLADKLNIENELVWTNRENNLPTLSYGEEKYK